MIIPKFEDKISSILLDHNERVVIDIINKQNNFSNNFTIEDNTLLFDSKSKIYEDYAAVKVFLPLIKSKFTKLVTSVSNSFINDSKALFENRLISSDATEAIDIDLGAGDIHNGKSTSIILLNSGERVVFKPTNSRITRGFHNFLDWVNVYHSLGEYRFNILDRGDYHWLEFVNQKSIENEEFLKDYYTRAGYLLCLTYFLNSCDYHYENVISNGNSPVLIDHETIVQPKVASEFLDNVEILKSDAIEDSVLRTMLLPNVYSKSAPGSFPIGMCGYGWEKEQGIFGLVKVGKNRFTKDWKMGAKFVQEDYFKNNIPEYQGQRVYWNEYLEEFLNGFEACYRFLISNRNFLLDSQSSPLTAFENCKVRFIWRPTNIYAKILEKMKLPKNLKTIEAYEKQIRGYLSVAFKNVPKDSNLQLIYEHEVAQMMRGDIPYFEINTSSKDLVTEFGTIKDFFQLNCLENIEYKLKRLSENDLDIQKNIIIDCAS